MGPQPHPYAGSTGEGPPLAPPNWKWRAGNRVVDMYFYSPSGQQFRSRTELASYLLTLPDPPDASMFLWRIPPEILESGYKPPPFDFAPQKRKRKARQASFGAQKRIKAAPPLDQQQRVHTDDARPSTSAVRAEELPQSTAGTAQQLNLPQGVGSTAALEQYGVLGKSKNKRAGAPVLRSFKSILAGRSSFKWLHNPVTMEKFLEEARRLTFKTPAEINELRKILLERRLDRTNICKYSNSAIRVFALLLRNEEPPASMDKGELADLCVTWRCKKRHYWCLLEVGRVKSHLTKFSKVAEPSRGGRLANQVVRPNTQSNSASTESGWREKFHVGRPQPNSLPAAENLPAAAVAENPPAAPVAENPPAAAVTESPPATAVAENPPAAAVAENPPAAAVAENPPAAAVAENPLTSAQAHAQGQAQDSASGSIEKMPEGAMPSESGNRNLPERLASGLNGDDGFTRTADTGGAAEPAAGDGMFVGPQENEAPSHGREGATNGESIESTKCFPNSNHSSHPSRPWASCSELMMGLSMRESDEPAPSANHSGAEPSEESDPRSSDLCGESIIVITGFKSGRSKGSENGHQVDDTTQIKRGNCAVNGLSCPGFSDSAPWASNGRIRPGGFPSRAPAVTVEKNGLDAAPTSKREGTSTGPCNSVGSGKSDKFLDSNCQVAMQSHEFKTSVSRPQDTIRQYQGSMPDNPPSSPPPPPVLRDRSGISQEDLCETLFASRGTGYRLLSDPTTSKDVAHGSAALEDKRAEVSSVTNDGLIGMWGAGPSKEIRIWNTRAETAPTTLLRHFSGGNFICWCRICGSDSSFCRGCMCSFCKSALQHGEDWTVVKCICDHVCHIDCAIAANAAGVVKELGLDGELSCPSCAQKVDLWPFFLKRFDLILSLTEVAHVNLKGLEKLLLQAVKLLKGSEKNRYKSLEDLVVESYELTRKFPVLVLIQQLVRTIRDELCTGRPDIGSVEDELNHGAYPRQIDVLKEKLAKESLENAKSERLLMETTIENVQRAYEDALNKRTQARSASRSKTDNPKIVKERTDSLDSKELIVSQQAKVDLELKTLWDMRKFEDVDSLTVSTLDSSTLVWLENLKSQRRVVETAKIELKHLEASMNLSNLTPT